MRPILIAAIAAVAAVPLAGCNDGSEPAPEPTATGSAAPDTVPAEAVPGDDLAPAPAPTAIPSAVQGRWGLSAADCTSTRGDAKGLLKIGPETLTFYESSGKLGEIEEIDDSRIRARFAFTGEGMTWTREVVLDAQDGGQTLIRREYGEDAAPGPFRYTRCP